MNKIQGSFEYSISRQSANESNRFSFDVITFYALNIFSLGLYASYENLVLERKIKVLEATADQLEKQRISKIEKWNTLEERLTTLRGQLLKSTQNQFETAISELQASQTVISNEKPVFTLIKKPFDFAYFIANFIANYLTLGLFALYKHQSQQKRIEYLTRKIEPYQHHLEMDLGLIQQTYFQSAFKSTAQTYQLVKENEAIQSTVPLSDQEKHLASLRKMQIKLRYSKANLHEKVRILKATIEEAEDQKVDVLSQQKDLTHTINKLQSYLHKIEGDIKARCERIDDKKNKMVIASNTAKKIDGLMKQKNQMTASLELLRTTEKLQQKEKLGPIPPQYQKRTLDKQLPGDPSIDPNKYKTKELSKHAETVNGKRTAAEIVNAYYKYLLEKKYQSKSATLPHPLFIYRLVAMELIKGASLEETCQGYFLRLNDQDVTLSPSNPLRVQGLKYNEKNELVPYLKVIPTNMDEFTTDIMIEPDSICWILNRLNNDDQGLLRSLLKSPAYSENLLSVKVSQEKNALLRQAHALISDMGQSLQKKFTQ